MNANATQFQSQLLLEHNYNYSNRAGYAPVKDEYILLDGNVKMTV